MPLDFCSDRTARQAGTCNTHDGKRSGLLRGR